LIINDRIDIALAVGADGVHLGQTDMPIEVARKLLPTGAIIGISCNTRGEVKRAASAGADYVGIGSVYTTFTKKVTAPLVGPRNLGDILAALENTDVKSVAIGTLHQLVCDTTTLTCTQVGSNQPTRSALFSAPSLPQENRSMVSL
jgi:thiamine-phosphate diphosphorylase / hydroxyethylthiazole kinase